MIWTPVWHQATTHTLALGILQRRNKTVVWDVKAYTDGDRMRVRFSNLYGKKPYKIGGVSIYNGKDRYDITWKGKTKFSVPTGGMIWSDEIPVKVRAGDTLNVRLFHRAVCEDANGTEEPAVMYRGNRTKDETLPPKERGKLVQKVNFFYDIPTLCQIDLGKDSGKEPKAIVIFGDSITAMNRWVKPFRERVHEAYGNDYVVINSGIAGNSLIFENPTGLLGRITASAGDPGMQRFDRDVLDIPNLHTMVFALGTNDISNAGNEDGKRVVNFESMTKAMETCALRARAKGARTVFQTISPRMGSLAIPNGYTDDMDALRRQINEWAGTASCFDAVIDTASVVEDPDKPGWFREDLHQGDHLHPNTKGGQVIADAMDLAKIVGK